MPKQSDLSTKSKTKTSGTYTLVIYLSRAQTIRIGKLGTFDFPRGYYLYIGSAMNGLSARIARHLVTQRLANRAKFVRDNATMTEWRARKKKMHWHIDYLLEHAQVTEIWTHQGTKTLEHLWAQAALQLPKAKIVASRFGASDCKCATHLIYVGNR